MPANVALIQHVLQDYDPIRTTESQIAVTPENGKVILTGHVPSLAIKQLAAQLTSGVPGVQEVENSLVADTEVEQAVSWALATDPRTRLTTERIQISAWLGHVILKGPVLTEAVREAAGEIVRAIHGVSEVDNDLYESEALRAEIEAKERARKAAAEAAAAKAAAETPTVAPSTAAAPVADLPGWALKPKADWSKEDFRAFAMAKRAAKKGEGPPVEELLKAGEQARAGS
ncbi:MAG: BON domain-containing protein [Chloroflexi bacterium]|nr:BON domain-containing protein [Chloroflexota bacterium]